MTLQGNIYCVNLNNLSTGARYLVNLRARNALGTSNKATVTLEVKNSTEFVGFSGNDRLCDYLKPKIMSNISFAADFELTLSDYWMIGLIMLVVALILVSVDFVCCYKRRCGI